MPEDGRESFVDALTKSGYRTHGIGKCHFTPDIHALRGFQTREYQEHPHPDSERDDYCRFLKDNGYGDTLNQVDYDGMRGPTGHLREIPQLSHLPEQLHPTQWTGDRSIAFLEKAVKDNQPWFLFSSFIHPHPPLALPPAWAFLYDWAQMPVPIYPESKTKCLQKFLKAYKSGSLKKKESWYFDEEYNLILKQYLRAFYYAAITFIDFQIGRITSVLEKYNQLDKTLIIFTSDHGEYLGDHCRFGKLRFHDSSARIPLIMRYPDSFPAGEICSKPVSLVDIAPTVLSFAGAKIKSHVLDGENLAEIAAGTINRDMVFSQIFNPSRYMAVNRQWKYTYSPIDNNEELLFDRENDPEEIQNKAGQQDYLQIQKDLRLSLIKQLNIPI